MKFLALIILTFFSGFVKADEFQWCQLQIDAVKDYYETSVEDLVNKKSNIATSDSVETLSEATGRDYKEMVSMLSKENVNEEKAVEFVIQFMKSFELKNISMAIKLKELHKEYQKEADAYFWNNFFDSCVENSGGKS